MRSRELSLPLLTLTCFVLGSVAGWASHGVAMLMRLTLGGIVALGGAVLIGRRWSGSWVYLLPGVWTPLAWWLTAGRLSVDALWISLASVSGLIMVAGLWTSSTQAVAMTYLLELLGIIFGGVPVECLAVVLTVPVAPVRARDSQWAEEWLVLMVVFLTVGYAIKGIVR